MILNDRKYLVIGKKIMTKTYSVKSKFSRLLSRKNSHAYARTQNIVNRIVVQYRKLTLVYKIKTITHNKYKLYSRTDNNLTF